MVLFFGHSGVSLILLLYLCFKLVLIKRFSSSNLPGNRAFLIVIVNARAERFHLFRRDLTRKHVPVKRLVFQSFRRESDQLVPADAELLQRGQTAFPHE